MFKLDMQALRETAHAPPSAQPLAKLAKLVISQPPQGHANDLLGTRLMAAAMRRCDQLNDSEVAREAMRNDVLDTPQHLRQDLLEHFNQQERKP